MKRVFVFLLGILTMGGLRAQDAASMKQFMDMRFGMFVHFGTISLRGTEFSWSRNREVSEADYDSLYKEWDPVLFNADAWVRTAKEAGMKYLTITAKHHDGFCNWPTAVSAYSVAHTAFKRDIVGELAAACRRQGIVFCVYFTVLDWHDPDWPTSSPYDSTKDRHGKGDMVKFVQTMKAELKEIVTKYKPFMLWFDGHWEPSWTVENGKDIYSFLKKLDPKLIVNNRLGKDGSSLSSPASVGDFLTPEQTIGQLDTVNAWESCLTICTQWSWKPNDTMKSLKQCIQSLVRSAGGNGNLLLNVGPMMDGRIEARQATRLREMGVWMRKYGESIYGTKGGPFPATEHYAMTRKGKVVYVHVFDRQNGVVRLPAFRAKVLRARWMGGGDVAFRQMSDGVELVMPAKLPDENCSVVVLDFVPDSGGF